MSRPQWITPAGHLGTLPELEFWQYDLDAYSPSGDTLTFTFLSGEMPPGVQCTRTGRLQGVPTVTDTTKSDQTRTYKFTIRITDSNSNIVDRSFNISVSGIQPPVITNTVEFLGYYFDGQKFNLQLKATDDNPNSVLSWSLVSGSLPEGISLKSDGTLTGLIYPVYPLTITGLNGYDSQNDVDQNLKMPYDFLGYDIAGRSANATYNFVVRVSDGANFDEQAYRISVLSKALYTTDNTDIQVDNSYTKITFDNRYVPIITTNPKDIITARAGNYYSFKFDAVDFDNDTIEWAITDSSSSGFDQFGTVGFDSAAYDQSDLKLPTGILIDPATGWIYGHLGDQAESEKTYQFLVYAYKQGAPTYISDPTYCNLTVLGNDINTISWSTDSNLGLINNGALSHLYVSASNSLGKDLVYSLAPKSLQSLPQGLKLLPNGLISGRTSFGYFRLDGGATTFDKNKTTVDNVYEFTIRATAADSSVYSDKTFKITLDNYNIKPYDNLYLKALPTVDQRETFLSIINNQEIFPDNLIYRKDDPWFGKANTIKTLFLAGIDPGTMAEYVNAVTENHYNKNVDLGQIKTATAVDENQNPLYEVVYIAINDVENNAAEAKVIDLTGKINPYLEGDQNYSVVYTNSYESMKSRISNTIGYSNRGVLPEWMSSVQDNGKVLGFTRAVVLAYTVPGASKLIAYRLKNNGITFADLDFTVDRYQVDNSLSNNFNKVTDNFYTSRETSFDYMKSETGVITTVTYAPAGTPFMDINNKTITYINNNGGIDGFTRFNHGDTLVFSQQENFGLNSDTKDGWLDFNDLWDNQTGFDSTVLDDVTVIPGFLDKIAKSVTGVLSTSVSSGNTVSVKNFANIANITEGMRVTGSGVPTDTYVTAINGTLVELTKNITSSVAANDQLIFEPVNQRSAVWQISIDFETEIVTLNFVKEILPGQRIKVTSGRSFGSTTLFYNPAILAQNTVPTFSVWSNKTNNSTGRTKFDGDGTRFMDYRDTYETPESGDKYIKFPKIGVFT